MSSEHADIICVANPSWEGDYVKSTVKIMAELAANHRILYVDYQYTIKDLIWGMLGKSEYVPVKRMLGLETPLRKLELEDNTYIYILTPPPILSINFIRSPAIYDFFAGWNAGIIARSVKKAIRQIGIKNPKYVNAFTPQIGVFLQKKLNITDEVYYCYDEISTCLWAKNHGKRLEDKYLKMVDKVIVSSKGLYDTKHTANENCHIVNNGVDFDLFHQSFVKLEEKEKPKKILYIGSIDSRLDYGILTEIAIKFPNHSLVMVGRLVYDEPYVKEKIEKLKLIPNVIFEGAKAPEELGAYLAQATIGIIPFVKNDQTAAIYPMKINEYLAAGLAVVSTDFADLSTFKGLIDIARTKENFVSSISDYFENDNQGFQNKRVSIAKGNSWEKRAVEFSKLLR